MKKKVKGTVTGVDIFMPNYCHVLISINLPVVEKDIEGLVGGEVIIEYEHEPNIDEIYNEFLDDFDEAQWELDFPQWLAYKGYKVKITKEDDEKD